MVKLQLVGRIADVEREIAHRRRPERNRLAAWVAQIPGFELQIGTAVGKARLIDGDAVQRQRMVDADGVFGFFAAFLVGNFQIAGKITRHPGIVKVDVEFLQLHFKRQILNQHPVVGIEEDHVRALPFGNVHIAAERQVRRTQNAFRFEVFGIDGMIVRHDASGQHTDFQQEVAVYQAAQANHNQRGMGKNIAPLVHRPFFGGNQNRSVFARYGFAAEALYFEITPGNFRRHLAFQHSRMAHRRQ